MKDKRVRTSLGIGTVIREFEQEDQVTYWGMTKGAVKQWLEVRLDRGSTANFHPYEVSEIVTYNGRPLSDYL